MRLNQYIISFSDSFLCIFDNKIALQIICKAVFYFHIVHMLCAHLVSFFVDIFKRLVYNEVRKVRNVGR